MHKKRLIIKYKKQIFILVLTIIISIIMYFFSILNKSVDTQIKREDVLSSNKDYEIKIKGIDNLEYKLNIEVSSKKYKKRELDEVFERVRKKAEELILGENESFEKVVYDLNFIKYIKEYDARVNVKEKDFEFFDEGKVLNKELKKVVETQIEIEIFIGDEKRTYEKKIFIYPKEKLSNLDIKEELEEYIKKEDEKQKENDYFILPSRWKNYELKYEIKKDKVYVKVLIFGLLLTLLSYFIEVEREKKKEQLKKQQALLEYPEIVSKYLIFLEAGLSSINILEKIIQDYEKSDVKKEYEVYKELRKLYQKIKNRVSENLAYREFARNIGLRQYNKFIGILEQNRKNGVYKIISLLELECKEAFNERINLARKNLGKIQTKMLIPLGILLIVVLGIVITPSMLNVY